MKQVDHVKKSLQKELESGINTVASLINNSKNSLEAIAKCQSETREKVAVNILELVTLQKKGLF